MDGLEWKTLLKWMIWGYHYFWKHPNGGGLIHGWFGRIKPPPFGIIYLFVLFFPSTGSQANLSWGYVEGSLLDRSDCWRDGKTALQWLQNRILWAFQEDLFSWWFFLQIRNHGKSSPFFTTVFGEYIFFFPSTEKAKIRIQVELLYYSTLVP